MNINLKQWIKIPGFLCLGGLLLLSTSCTERIPEHPLNPASDEYVGDEEAVKDSDGDGIADVVEDTYVSSSAVDPGTSSSGTSNPGSSSETSNPGSSSTDGTSSGGSSGNNSSSGANPSSSSSGLIPKYTLTVSGGVIASTGNTSGEFSVGMPVSIKGNTLPIGTCFDQWTSDNATIQDASKMGTTIQMPASNVTITASTTACADPLTYTDPRDGEQYLTEYGPAGLLWMSSNLRYDPPTADTWCYGDDEANCETYGRLYDWATAMGLAESYNSSDAGNKVGDQGICPDGWHIPAKSEISAAAEDLNLPYSGNRTSYGSYETLTSIGFYWTSETGKADALPNDPRNFCDSKDSNPDACATAWVHNDNASEDWIHYAQEDDKILGFSVRCALVP